MKNLLLVLVSLASILTIYCSNTTKKPIKIIPIKMIDRTYWDSGISHPYLTYSINFLVEDYVENANNEAKITAFANKNADTSLFKGSYMYRMYFYKASKHTNLKNIAKDKNVIPDYSLQHDIIFIFSWYDGKYRKLKMKNGFPVDDVNDQRKVEIRDIDTSK
jgi:hypothetical protein